MIFRDAQDDAKIDQLEKMKAAGVLTDAGNAMLTDLKAAKFKGGAAQPADPSITMPKEPGAKASSKTPWRGYAVGAGLIYLAVRG